MGYIIQQIESLRQEIVTIISQTLSGVMVLAFLAVAAYIVAVALEKREIYRLTVVLLVSIPYFVARQDYVQHRTAAWIRLAEVEIASQEDFAEKVPTWEQWKNQRKSRTVILPVVDILAALALLYIFWQAETVLWSKFNDTAFFWTTVIGLIAGILLIPVVIKLSDW